MNKKNTHEQRIQDEFKLAFKREPGLTSADYCELTRLAYPPNRSPSYCAESDAALRSQASRKARHCLQHSNEEDSIIAVPDGSQPRLYPERQQE